MANTPGVLLTCAWSLSRFRYQMLTGRRHSDEAGRALRESARHPGRRKRCGWFSSPRPGRAAPLSWARGWARSSAMVPGSVKGLHLVVDDMAATRAALTERGIELSDVEDMGGVLYSHSSYPEGYSAWALQQWPAGYQA